MFLLVRCVTVLVVVMSLVLPPEEFMFSLMCSFLMSMIDANAGSRVGFRLLLSSHLGVYCTLCRATLRRWSPGSMGCLVSLGITRGLSACEMNLRAMLQLLLRHRVFIIDLQMPLSVVRSFWVFAFPLDLLNMTYLLTLSLLDIWESAPFEMSETPRCASPFLLTLWKCLNRLAVMTVFRTELLRNLRCLHEVEMGRRLMVSGRATVVATSLWPVNARP